MKVLLVFPNKNRVGSKPIGLSLIVADLVKNGHEVEIFDTTEYFPMVENVFFKSQVTVERKHSLLEDFREIVPCFDFVGFSVLDGDAELCSQLAEIAHEYEVLCVWGNNFPTMNPLKSLDMGADTICKGEGVGYFTGTSYKELDDYPFLNWDFFKPFQFSKPYDGKTYRGGDHMIGHGCPRKCSYCVNHVLKPNVRKYSVDRIIEEINFLEDKYGINFWKFHDEDFLLKPTKYLYELSKKYRGTPFVGMVNAASVTEEKVEILKKMGCVSISMGIESGSPRIRKMLRRSETIGDIINAGKLFKKHGIRTCSFNMIGLPFEEENDIEKTITLNGMAEIYLPTVSFFFPIQGTDLYNLCVENNLYIPGKVSEESPNIVTACSEELLLMYRKSWRDLC